jgi:hypothetical protein
MRIPVLDLGRDQFAALLPIQERVLGPNHPRTLAWVRAQRAYVRGHEKWLFREFCDR